MQATASRELLLAGKFAQRLFLESATLEKHGVGLFLSL